MTSIQSIQVEDTLHIIPADDTDLHDLVEPCTCGQKRVWLHNDPVLNGMKYIVIHNTLTNPNNQGEPT